ncbi:MAG: hypothetical protein AAF264_01680 [Pseudomonadota bacterium]
MGPTELMYDIPSYFISLGLFALMVGAMLLGRRTGDRIRMNEPEEARSQASAVQGSLLGLLALLLGFTFSLALGRFDQRSIAVVDEANAIGTAFLRTDLLSDERRDSAKGLITRYGIVRVEAARVGADEDARRAQLVTAADTISANLWALASAEAREVGGPVAMAFAASVNDMIDALASRDAAIERHVPELVLFLLFGTFVLLGGVIGFASALSGVRPGVPVYAMMVLIVVLVFLIIDLDRPRRGLIEVDQTKLVTTVEAMQRPSDVMEQ